MNAPRLPQVLLVALTLSANFAMALPAVDSHWSQGISYQDEGNVPNFGRQLILRDALGDGSMDGVEGPAREIFELLRFIHDTKGRASGVEYGLRKAIGDMSRDTYTYGVLSASFTGHRSYFGKISLNPLSKKDLRTEVLEEGPRILRVRGEAARALGELLTFAGYPSQAQKNARIIKNGSRLGCFIDETQLPVMAVCRISLR